MPRFFIDTDDGRLQILDDEGHDLPDAQAARDLAVRALLDMARSSLSQSDRRVFTAQVRSENGSSLYSAELALAGEWSSKPPAP